MTKPLILCVDDEKNILDLLAFNLGNTGYSVMTETTGRKAVETAKELGPALIILDLMLPDITGMEALRLLRANPATASVPIIVLTAADSEADTLLAFELGADGYVKKPFGIRELMARVKAMLRRTGEPMINEKICIGPLTIHPETYEAYLNEEKLSLTLKEYELLRHLAAAPGKVMTRTFLLDRIWGYEFYGETRTVDVHIRHIRQKLGDEADLIETVRGVGYKMRAIA